MKRNVRNSPGVSVIIPCYNHAHYLPDAVNSVLAQTFTDWEALIVDDGSTDNTREVAAQFTDSRIRYIYQENRGLSGARNTGIRAAEGEYLAFLDADDLLTPTFFETCLAALRADTELAGVYTRNHFVDEAGNLLPRRGGQALAGTAFRARILEGGFFPPVSAMVRRTVVVEVGMFDEQLTSVEDWDLWLRLSARYPLQGIAEPLVCYRVYAGSMSTNAARMHANRIAVLTKHFGSPEGDPADWPEEKRRAYGFAYRSGANGYIEQGQVDEGWHLLARGVALWPDLLRRLDTFYELACGDQPKGYRGQAESLDIESNGTELLRQMERLFIAADVPSQALKSVAYGNAYLALTMLSDQAGQCAQAHRYMLQALRANPQLLRQPSVLRRLLKLFAGKRVISWLRRFKKTPESVG